MQSILSSSSIIIAWGGAGLSTLLALIKLWELWQSRFRIEIGYDLSGNREIGNCIQIRNMTNHTLILKYWELLYCAGRWPFLNFEKLRSPNEINDISIASHTAHTLRFSGADHFDWGVNFLKGRSICIRLHIAGKRPFTKSLKIQ